MLSVDIYFHLSWINIRKHNAVQIYNFIRNCHTNHLLMWFTIFIPTSIMRIFWEFYILDSIWCYKSFISSSSSSSNSSSSSSSSITLLIGSISFAFLSLKMLSNKFFVRYIWCKYLFPVCELTIHFLVMSLEEQKFLILMNFN